MARTGRPTAELVLTEDERETLQRWARRLKSAQALALRAKIVLACAQGATNKAVAVQFSVTPQMVGKWRSRFVADRLAGLFHGSRPGRPRTITDVQVEQVVTATLDQAPPDEGTHWSTRLMAAHTGLTQTAVSRIWRTFELKPHQVDYWKLSTDPHFVDKLYDVVGLYLDPPDEAVDPDPRRVAATNAELHRAEARYARNEHLRTLANNVHNLGQRLSFLCFGGDRGGALDLHDHLGRVCTDHSAMLDAIRTRDLDEAERIAARHVHLFRGRVIEFFEKTPSRRSRSPTSSRRAYLRDGALASIADTMSYRP
ncbi:IS630 family transposase [Pseudonocardia nigra]|uniref:IS630 family transposase n=1 Tax=Pseudonocardia nigra TaxID=1921578 RepID=UPI001C5E721B|nr:IS630 family transposase [Pseudonocardia nigra]